MYIYIYIPPKNAEITVLQRNMAPLWDLGTVGTAKRSS